MATSAIPPVTLTPDESALFSILTSCAHWIDETNALGQLEDVEGADVDLRAWKQRQDVLGSAREKVQLRVAGGWVRDKVSHLSTWTGFPGLQHG